MREAPLVGWHLSKGPGSERGWDIWSVQCRWLGEECCRQREHQVQRPWDGNMLRLFEEQWGGRCSKSNVRRGRWVHWWGERRIIQGLGGHRKGFDFSSKWDRRHRSIASGGVTGFDLGFRSIILTVCAKWTIKRQGQEKWDWLGGSCSNPGRRWQRFGSGVAVEEVRSAEM